MEEIKIAILAGYKTVEVNGIVFELLPKLPRFETRERKEKFAEEKAKELAKFLED